MGKAGGGKAGVVEKVPNPRLPPHPVSLAFALAVHTEQELRASRGKRYRWDHSAAKRKQQTSPFTT